MDELENKVIELNVKLNIKDLLKFRYRHYYGGLGGKFKIIFNVFLLGLIVMSIIEKFVFGSTDWFVTDILPVISIMLLFSLIPPIAIYFQSKWAIKRDSFFGQEEKYRFLDTGISISTDSAQASIRWEQVYKIVFFKHAIAIYVAPKRAFIIPKRIFVEDSNDLEELKEMIKLRMPKKKVKLKYKK